MKYLALILLFGLASAAYVHDDLLDDYYEDLIISQKNFISFAEAEKDLKTELGRRLKHSLDRILEEIRDTVARGKSVSRELIDQARDTLVKLKETGVELETRTKDLLHDVKDKLTSWWREVLDKLNVHKDKNEVQHGVADIFRKLVERYNLHEKFEKLQKLVAGNANSESVISFMREHFPLSEKFLNKLVDLFKESRDKFQDLLARIMNRG